MIRRILLPVVLAALAATPLGAPAASPTDSKTLTVYAAGSLRDPFQRIGKAFEKRHPGIVVKSEFGGSVTMARRIAEQHQHADVFASADYAVIPDVLGKHGLASWYVGFSSNALTLVYTAQSQGAGRINAANWYRIVSEPGVVTWRSNPNSDPGGYRFVQMLSLASRYYHQPDLVQKVLANAPLNGPRRAKGSPLAALRSGRVDYLAAYASSAKAPDLESLKLPSDINLSDPAKLDLYARGAVRTDRGVLHAKPILYGVTVPTSAHNPQLAVEFVRFLIGPEGHKILADSGFTPLHHPLAHGGSSLPATLKSATRPWPAKIGNGK